MYQLNNETNNVKSKMKTRTKIIIFLVIFALIAIGVTITAIFYTNTYTDSKTSVAPNTSVNTVKPVKVTPDGLEVKSLTEQYNENDLKISTLTDNKGTRVSPNTGAITTNKLDIDYIQIDGLKNSAIENQINTEIQNLVYSLCSDDEINNPDIDFIDISVYCNANFGNVLSLDISKSVYYIDDENNFDIENHYLNYNLVTGEKLAFKDLFTNASIRNALVQSIYDELLYNYTHELIDEDNPFFLDMSKADLSTLEDETYVMVNKIMNNLDTIEFNFTPSSITLEIDDTSLYIDMVKIYKHIAIYNRFKTDESIFDGTFEGQKNIFVFTERYINEYTQYCKYEDIYDNLRVEAHVEFSGYGENVSELLANSNIQKALNDCISQVKEKISDIEKEAKENPDKAYIYCADYRVGTTTDRDLNDLNIEHRMVYTSGSSTVYEMSKNYYDETYYAKIGEFYREDAPYVRYVFEGYYYIDEDNTNVKVTEEHINTDDEEYDIYTGKTKDELLNEYYTSFQNIELTPVENTISSEISQIDSNTIN